LIIPNLPNHCGMNYVKMSSKLRLKIVCKLNSYVRQGRSIRKTVSRTSLNTGIVHIFSAMEPCPAYIPWHDKTTGKTQLKYKNGRCLHYYFYFIDVVNSTCKSPNWAYQDHDAKIVVIPILLWYNRKLVRWRSVVTYTGLSIVLFVIIATFALPALRFWVIVPWLCFAIRKCSLKMHRALASGN
jgi:hypothetical protein